MKCVLFLSIIFAFISLAAAQDNPIEVRIDAYIVSQDGLYYESTTARPSQVVEYWVFATNTDLTTMPAESVSVLGPVPETQTYIPRSASYGDDFLVEYTADNEVYSRVPTAEVKAVRWTYLKRLEPGEEIKMTYRVVIGDELPTEIYAEFSGFGSSDDEETQTGTHTGSGSADDFTQAMFGHLGIIEMECSEDILQTAGDDTEAVCGMSTDNFDLFRQKWNLYADYESEVPVVPEPVSAWRSVNGMFTREYNLNGRGYIITYFEQSESSARLVLALY